MGKQLLRAKMSALVSSIITTAIGALTYDASLWSSVGIVPTFIPTAPPESLWVYWPTSGLSPRMNETVDTGDIMTPPMLFWNEPWEFWGSLYTVMIVDFGVDRDGANVVHWMKHNVQQGIFGSEGVENFDYLPPFSYDCNEDCSEIIDTGDAAVHQTAVLVFRQASSIDVAEVGQGCNQQAIFGRRQDISALIDTYSLGDPIAGKLFWTKYSPATNELFCYSTLCTGIPFPFPMPGVNDLPECQAAQTAQEAGANGAEQQPAFTPATEVAAGSTA